MAQSGQDPTTYMQSEATLVHFPYRLGFSALKGSLYVADYSNKAVRRFFVLPVCACANNYVPVPDANSCYNPSPRWNARQLPHCAPGTRPICFACLSAVASRVALTRLPAAGFFALEGESTCAHPCSDAAAMGVSVICLSAAPPPPLTFDQVSTALMWPVYRLSVAKLHFRYVASRRRPRATGSARAAPSPTPAARSGTPSRRTRTSRGKRARLWATSRAEARFVVAGSVALSMGGANESSKSSRLRSRGRRAADGGSSGPRCCSPRA